MEGRPPGKLPKKLEKETPRKSLPMGSAKKESSEQLGGAMQPEVQGAKGYGQKVCSRLKKDAKVKD